jgi:hypothetical protein
MRDAGHSRLGERRRIVADGWAVKVTAKVLGGDEWGGESTRTYYAHIPDRVAAERAVARHISAAFDEEVEATVPIPHDMFVSMGVDEGGVAQWA